MTQETFERELARRADEVHGAPLTLADVRGRARGIQRRRAAATAAVVAAAVAAVALAPALVSGGSHRSEPAPAPAPPSGHTSVLHDGVVTTEDGTVPLPVDNADVTQLGVLSDGRVVLALQRPQAIRVYQPDGTVEATYRPSYNTFTMSRRHDAVAWVARDLSVQVLSSGAAAPATLPGIPMPGEAAGTINAVLDAEHLLVGDGTTTVGEVTPEGYADLATPEPFRVDDISPSGDLWSVDFIPDADHQFGCSGLYDPRARTIVARRCDTGALRFAPDGRHLLGVRGENNMMTQVTTYDRALRPVGTVTGGDGAVVSRASWADADHLLLATVHLDTNAWSLERVSVDGAHHEVVAGPTSGRNPEMVVEYLPTS